MKNKDNELAVNKANEQIIVPLAGYWTREGHLNEQQIIGDILGQVLFPRFQPSNKVSTLYMNFSKLNMMIYDISPLSTKIRMFRLRLYPIKICIAFKKLSTDYIMA